MLFVRQARGPFAGHWLFPGGTLEPGETPLDGARREAREESGCELGAAELVAVYDVRSQPEGAFHFITHLYRGTLLGDPVAEPGSEARWLDPRELPLSPVVRRELADGGALADGAAASEAALNAAGVRMERIG